MKYEQEETRYIPRGRYDVDMSYFVSVLPECQKSFIHIDRIMPIFIVTFS